MKIAFDHEIFCLQNRGGISRYFCCLADEFKRLGHEVSAFAPYHVNESLETCKAISVQGKKINHYPPKLGGLSVKYNAWKGAKEIRKWQAQVVHKTYYSPLQTDSYRAPHVVTVHDMIHELFPEEFRQKDNTQALKRRAVLSADWVICISDNTKKDLLQFVNVNETKISVIHHGIGLQPTRLSVSNQTRENSLTRPMVLYVGARNKYKNFTSLVRGIGHSLALREGVELLAFGGGPFTNEEHTLLQHCGVKHYRHESGDDEKLVEFYQNAAAFVYPSLYEGFGFPPLEAMALGCPVISSNTSVLPEILGNACLYFNPNDEKQLADSVERVLSSPALRNELITAGHYQSAKYSWETTAKRTLTVYQSLL